MSPLRKFAGIGGVAVVMTAWISIAAPSRVGAAQESAAPGWAGISLPALARDTTAAGSALRDPAGSIRVASLEDLAPTREFPDDAPRVYLVVEAPRDAKTGATWFAVDVEGREPDEALGSSGLWGNSELSAYWLERAESDSLGLGLMYPDISLPGHAEISFPAHAGGGLPVGQYRVELTVGASPTESLDFEVLPALPPATLLELDAPVRGWNIALAELGGRIESATSYSPHEPPFPYGENPGSPANLIDGISNVSEDQDLDWSGWVSARYAGPQEVVFSFRDGREASVDAVVLDTAYAPEHFDAQFVPRHAEVWASTTSPTDGFTLVGGGRLAGVAGRQRIAFPPATAKYVKLRFLSAHGGPGVQLAEVEILEANDGQPSILADLPRNLASPALGGAVVRYTSLRSGHHVMDELLGEARSTRLGWTSEQGDAHLPQEIVFAFRGDREALIDRVVLNPLPPDPGDPASWPKRVLVSVSSENPFDGFEEVGEFTLAQEGREQSFPVGKRARFLKLRILENYGGTETHLGDVQIIEGSAPGYESILLGPSQAGSPGARAFDPGPIDEAGAARESERNDLPSQANALELGRRTLGTIEPLGEQDHFRFAVPEGANSIVTVEFLGRPHLRTSLALLDSTGGHIKTFDPGAVPAERAEFSWQLQPGDHVLRVSAPPASVVLIWDTSGSMSEENVRDLQQAVEGYLEAVEPSERLNLIRFSGGGRLDRFSAVEVLLSEFTSDRERLRAAVKDKFFREGGTPFNDAVAGGLELLKGVPGNRAIIVMTDGVDTASELDHSGFWTLLEKERVRLYTIGLGDELTWRVRAIGSTGGRVLDHAARATRGRFFFARTSDELQGIYEEIAAELRRPATYALEATLGTGVGRLAVTATGERIAAVASPGKIELILDASGSMKRKLGGRVMMEIAKEAMAQIVGELPDDAEVALRVYGHRIREGRTGDCQDSELVFPMGKIDKSALLTYVHGIRGLGTTPIAYSLQQVATDLAGTEGPKMVILVTDGKEECRGDPMAAVEELSAKGIDVRLNIVGFALADTTDKRQMRAVAERTGGSYFDATNAKALGEAIRQALAVSFEVLDASGARVGGGITGQGEIELLEGVYTVIVPTVGEALRVEAVRVTAGGSTEVRLRKEGEKVGVEVVP